MRHSLVACGNPEEAFYKYKSPLCYFHANFNAEIIQLNKKSMKYLKIYYMHVYTNKIMNLNNNFNKHIYQNSHIHGSFKVSFFLQVTSMHVCIMY
jgi:hypothetical protein